MASWTVCSLRQYKRTVTFLCDDLGTYPHKTVLTAASGKPIKRETNVLEIHFDRYFTSSFQSKIIIEVLVYLYIEVPTLHNGCLRSLLTFDLYLPHTDLIVTDTLIGPPAPDWLSGYRPSDRSAAVDV